MLRPGADFRRDPQALRILRGIQVGTPGAPSGRGQQPEAVRGARPEGLGQEMVERTPLVEGFAPPPYPRSPAQPAERAGPQQNAHPVCCFSLGREYALAGPGSARRRLPGKPVAEAR